MQRHHYAASIGLAIIIATSHAHAGGPGVEERKLQLGKCLPSGMRCVFDCNSSTAVCPTPTERCTFDATEVFTGVLTWEVNDTPGSCSLSLMLNGKSGGSTFTASQSNITMGCGMTTPCSVGIPRTTPFFCGDDAQLDESTNWERLKAWLDHSKFPSQMASEIAQKLGHSGDTPIIVEADDCETVEDHAADTYPTKVRFCIKGYLVRQILPQPARTCTSARTPRPCPCP